jgi:hypothetical protein
MTGRIRVEPSDATIYILDGEARMVSGWTLYANSVVQLEDLGGNDVMGTPEQTVTTGAER